MISIHFKSLSIQKLVRSRRVSTMPIAVFSNVVSKTIAGRMTRRSGTSRDKW